MPKKLPTTLLLPHLALLASALIWAVAAPVIKLTLSDVPVFTFLLYRFTLVGLILLPYMFIELRRNPIHKKDFPNFIILGIASQVSIALIFLGLNFTTAIDTAIIGVLAPVLTFLAGRYFYEERITKIETLGIVLATAGTLFIVLEPILGKLGILEAGEVSVVDPAKRVLGNFFVLLYQLSWPVYIILGKNMMGETSREITGAFKFLRMKKMSKKYSSTIITAFSFYVGLAFFIPMAVVEGSRPGFHINLTITSITGILYMVALSSIAAYGLYQWGMKYLEAQETALYFYLTAVLTIPAAYFLLGEIPTKTMIAGSLVIAAGVIIAEKFKS